MRDGGELTLADNGEKTLPFRHRDPFIGGWPCHFRGPNVPPHACHVWRPNLRFDGRTWTSLTYAFGGLKHSRSACPFGGRTWDSVVDPGSSSKAIFIQNSISFLIKIIKYIKTFYKNILLPF